MYCSSRPKDRRAQTANGAGPASDFDRQLRRTSESTGALFASQYSLEEYGGLGSSSGGHGRAVAVDGSGQQPKMIYSQSFSNGLPSERQEQRRLHQQRPQSYHHHHHGHYPQYRRSSRSGLSSTLDDR